MNMKEIEEFKKYLKNIGRSQNTIQSYCLDVIHFLTYFKITKVQTVQDISLDKYREYFASLRSSATKKIPNTPLSIRRKISSIKKFVKFLQDKEFIQNANIFLIQNPKLGKRLPKTIQHNEILTILEYTKNKGVNKTEWQNKRDYLIIKMMLIFGLRISEILTLKQDIINNENFIITGKGAKERLLPMIKEIKNEIQEYLLILPHNKDNLLFPSNMNKKCSSRIIQINFSKIKNILGISSDFTPHKLRHTCATNILNNGGNIRKIQKLLGHSNLNTTQVYTKIDKKTLLNTIQKIIS